MASREDFFVRFGSNAETWAHGLAGELSSAETAIRGVQNLMATLEATATRVTSEAHTKLLRLAEATDKQRRALADLDSAAAKSGEGRSGVLDSTSVIRDIQSFSAELDGLRGQLGNFIGELGQGAKAWNDAVKKQNQAVGQVVSEANQAGARTTIPRGTRQGDINPATGQPYSVVAGTRNDRPAGTAFTYKGVQAVAGQPYPVGTPIGGFMQSPSQGGQPVNYRQAAPPPAPTTPPANAAQLAQAIALASSQAVMAALGSTGVAAEPSISDIPKAMIDEASFQRVVTAVERNVTATNQVERAIDRLRADLKTGLKIRTGEDDIADAQPGDSATRRFTKDENSALYQNNRESLEQIRNEKGQEAFREAFRQLQVAAGNKPVALTPTAAAEVALTPEQRAVRKRFDELTQKVKGFDDALSSVNGELAQAENHFNDDGTLANPQLVQRLLAQQSDLQRLRDSAQKAIDNEETAAATRLRQGRDARRLAATKRDLETPEGLKEQLAERRALMDLAMDPVKLAEQTGARKDQFKKSDLLNIAEIFNQEGYPTATPGNGLRANATVPEILESLNRSGEIYKGAGRATATNFDVGRTIVDTTIPESVTSMLHGTELEVAKATERFNGQIKKAYETVGLHLSTGGTDPNRFRGRGRWEVGGAVGGVEHIGGDRLGVWQGPLPAGQADGRQQAVGDTMAGQFPADREDVRRAYQQIADYQLDAARSAAQAALQKVAENPLINPYHDADGNDPARTIEGKDDAAHAARRGVRQLQEGMAAVDGFAAKLNELNDRFRDSERHLGIATGKYDDLMQRVAEGAEVHPEDIEANERAIESAQRRLDQRRREIDEYVDSYAQHEPAFADEGRFTSPAFQEGMRLREASRQAIEAENEALSEQGQERARNMATLRSGIGQTLLGARTTDIGGNTKDFYTRLFPGLTFKDPTRGTDMAMGRSKGAQVDFESMFAQGGPMWEGDRANQNRIALGKFNSGLSRAQSALSQLTIALSEGGKSEDELNTLRDRARTGMARMVSSYSTMFPGRPAFDVSQVLRSEFEVSPRSLVAHSGYALPQGVKTGFDENEQANIDRLIAGERTHTQELGGLNARRDRVDALAGKVADLEFIAQAAERAAPGTDDTKSARAKANAAAIKLNRDRQALERAEADTGPTQAMLDKARAKGLANQIKSVRAAKKETEATIKTLQKEAGDATSALRKVMGKDSWTKVRDLEAAIPKTYGPERASMQESLDRAYSETPAIEEARAKQIATRATLEEAKATRELQKEKIEELQTVRKRVQGQVIPQDLERARADASGASKTLASAESQLTRVTARLTQARQELAREIDRIRGGMSDEDRGRYDDLERQAQEARTRRDAADTELNGLAKRTPGEETDRLIDAAEQARHTAELTEVSARTAQTSMLGAANLWKNAKPEDFFPDMPNLARGLANQPRIGDGRIWGETDGPDGKHVFPDSFTDRLRAGILTALQSSQVTDRIEAKTQYRPGYDPLDAAPFPAYYGQQPRSGFPIVTAEEAPSSRLITEENEAAAKIQRLSSEIERSTSDERQLQLATDQLRRKRAAADSTLEGLETRAAEIEARRRGAGGTGDGGDGTTAAEGGPHEGGDNILLRILAAIHEVNGTLKAGLKVTGKGELIPDVDENGQPVKSATRTRAVRESYDDASREAFSLKHAGLIPDLHEVGDAQQELTKATEVARQKLLTEAQTVQFFTDKLKLSKDEAKAFGDQLHRSLGAAELDDAANAFQSRLAKTQAQDDTTQTAEQRRAQQLADQQARDSRIGAYGSIQKEGAIDAVSDGVRDQIRLLEHLGKTGADNDVIARQMTKTYAQLSHELRSVGVNAQTVDKTAANLFGGAGFKVDTAELTEIARTARSQLEPEAISAFQGIFGGGGGFFHRVLNTTGTFVVRNFAADFVFGLTYQLHEVVSQALQAESTFIRVSAALESTGTGIGNLRSDLQDTSIDYGVALNDVYDTAAGLSGLFDTPHELAGATKVVSQLQAISNGALNAQEATGTLASIMGAFGDDLPDGVAGAQKVADVLTVIQNNMGVNVETSAEGVGRLAGLAQEMKFSFEQTAVFVAQIAKLTNQTGAAAGEQLSRIVGALQTPRAQGAVIEAFSEVGGQPTGIATDLGEGQYGDAIETMIRGWDGLSEAQQQSVSTAVAGQRQAATFAALMNNSAKTLDTLAKAKDADGEATERLDKLMNTLNRQLAVFGTNIQALASNIVRSGMLDFLGVLLKVTNTVLSLMNKLFSAANTLAEANPILKFARDVTFGLLGAMATVSLVRKVFLGFKEAVGDSRMASGFMDGFRATRSGAQRYTPVGPAFSEFGANPKGNYITRGLAFAADRTVGISMQGTGNALKDLGTRLNTSTRLVDGEVRARSRLVQMLGAGIGGVGTGLNRAGTGIRGFLQNGPSPTLDSWATSARGRASNYAFMADDMLTRRTIEQSLRPKTGVGDRLASFSQKLYGRAPVQDLLYGQSSLGTGSTAPTRTQIASAKLLQAANIGAAKTMSGLSSTLGALGRTGVGADLAMVGVAAAIGGLIKGLKDDADMLKAARTSAGIGEEEDPAKSDPLSPEYVGKAAEAFGRKWDSAFGQAAEDSWDGGNFSAAGQIATAALSDAVKNPVSFFKSGFDGSMIDRLGGTEGGASALAGTEQANEMLQQNLVTLENFQGDPEALVDAQERFGQKIEQAKQDIYNDASLSAREKTASIGQLEKAQAAFNEIANTHVAQAEGLMDNVIVGAEAIQAIQQLLSTIQTTGGSSVAGVDISSYYESLLKDTGLPETGEYSQVLRKLSSGTKDDVGQLELQRKLIRDLLKSSLQQLKELESDPNKSDAAAAYKTDVVGPLITQLQGISDDLAESIQSMADEAAQLASDRGNLPGALNKLGRAFNVSERNFRKDMRQLRRAARKALKEKRDLEKVIGGGSAEEIMNFFTDGIDVKGGKGGKNPGRNDKMIRRSMQQRADRINRGIALTEKIIEQATQKLDRQIALATDEQERAALEATRAALIRGILEGISDGDVTGLGLPDNVARLVKKHGKDMVSGTQLYDAQTDDMVAQQEKEQADKDAARQEREDARQKRQDAKQKRQDARQKAQDARQTASEIVQAQHELAGAYAEARGDAVAAAKASAAAARAALAYARTLKGPEGKLAVLNAQAALVAANAAVGDAQLELVQSRIGVAIAMAEAGGHTVKAAQLQIKMALAALHAATKGTAEYNSARAEVISAQAAARDAVLQDRLDTIDFNLQMGKITQSSAISALQEILRTQNLTKEQRRNLLLQIKGMKDELGGDSMWNFGDIKLPTPYLMRRYIEQRKKNMRDEIDSSIATDEGHRHPERRMRDLDGGGSMSGRSGGGTTVVENHTTTINIDGADIGQVKKIIRETVGSGVTVRTSQPRRGRR